MPASAPDLGMGVTRGRARSGAAASEARGTIGASSPSGLAMSSPVGRIPAGGAAILELLSLCGSFRRTGTEGFPKLAPCLSRHFTAYSGSRLGH